MARRPKMGPETYNIHINYSKDASVPNELPYLGWSYPYEYQHMVHQHWRSFSEPSLYYEIAFVIFFAVLLLTSLFGNGLVIWIFSTAKTLRTPSNLLIINLAAFDLTMALNMPHYLINAVMRYFPGGDLACDIYAVLGGISGMGAAITNAFIAYDRYRTISNPLDGRLNYKQIIILIAISWLWTIPFSVLPFLHIWGRYIPEGFLTSCSFDYLTDDDETRYFVRAMFIWAYCIPMIVICIYYTKLFLHVRQHEQMLADQAKKMNVKSLIAYPHNTGLSTELRIAKAAMIIYLMYVFAWTPYATIALLGTFGYSHLITPFASMIPCCCAKIVSCLDPWIYAASHPKYRAVLASRLPFLGIQEKGNSITSSNDNGNINGGGSNDGDATTLSVIA